MRGIQEGPKKDSEKKKRETKTHQPTNYTHQHPIQVKNSTKDLGLSSVYTLFHDQKLQIKSKVQRCGSEEIVGTIRYKIA